MKIKWSARTMWSAAALLTVAGSAQAQSPAGLLAELEQSRKNLRPFAAKFLESVRMNEDTRPTKGNGVTYISKNEAHSRWGDVSTDAYYEYAVGSDASFLQEIAQTPEGRMPIVPRMQVSVRHQSVG